MAAFSYQHSIFLSNTPISRSMSVEDANLRVNHFYQFDPPEPFYEDPLDVSFHEGSHIDNSSKIALSDDETSVTKKQNTDSSTVVDKLESGEQVTRDVSPTVKKRKNANGSSLNSSAQSKDARAKKSKKQKKSDGEMNGEEKKPKSDTKDQKKTPEEAPPTGYIHVRARRGQATDSHSLAERVRREKISERMKMLQRLVPGCDKVTGKAQMLDEIINYVQSLQNQVEFLSMKLASVYPLFYDFGMELDPFTIGPERLSSVQASSLPGMQQCSPTQPTAFTEANTVAATTRAGNSATVNNDPVVDSSAALLFPGHKDSGLWDVDEQRQKLVNPSGFSNSLRSFHYDNNKSYLQTSACKEM